MGPDPGPGIHLNHLNATRFEDGTEVISIFGEQLDLDGDIDFTFKISESLRLTYFTVNEFKCWCMLVFLWQINEFGAQSLNQGRRIDNVSSRTSAWIICCGWAGGVCYLATTR